MNKYRFLLRYKKSVSVISLTAFGTLVLAKISKETDELRTGFNRICQKAYDLPGALEMANVAKSELQELRRELESMSKHVPRSLDDRQLLPFYLAAGKNTEKAAKLIQSHYKIKQDSPEFFKNRDVNSADVQKSLNTHFFVVLPTTPDKNNLILFGLSNHDPSEYDFDSSAKTYIMSLDAAVFQNGPQNGMICIIDMHGAEFGHLFRPGVTSMMKGLKLLQEGCPIEMRAIHVLNTFPFVNIIMTMIKPFASHGLLSRVTWHPPGANFDEFHKIIPKQCLPSDYGGDLESIAELKEKHRQFMSQNNEYFLVEEKQMNFEF